MGKSGNRAQHQHGKFQSPFQHNSRRKFQHRGAATQGKYLFRKSKGGSFHQQLKTGITGVNNFDTFDSKKMKAITVCKAVGKNYMRARNFVNCEGLSDTIRKSPSSREASKHNKNVRTTISASGPENIRVAGEGSYLESRNSSRGVSEQHFSGGKKDEGNCLIINLKKKLNAFIPYEHFKMEGLHCLKFLLEQNDFLCKIDLKHAYLAIPLSKPAGQTTPTSFSAFVLV